MPLLKRGDLLRKEKLEVRKVELGNDEFVYVRQMTGRERDRFEQSLNKPTTDDEGRVTFVRTWEDFRAKLAVNTVCDEDGNNILHPDDVETLSTHMSAAKLELILAESSKLNRISEKDKRDLVKNSSGDQIGEDTSGSSVAT